VEELQRQLSAALRQNRAADLDAVTPTDLDALARGIEQLPGVQALLTEQRRILASAMLAPPTGV